MCFAPQRRALFRKSTSEPPKVDRTWCVLYILTWKCASRHNGVHLFESRHLSLQKWTEHAVFCTFWLRNVLRATTACTCSKVDIWASKSGPNMWCFVHFDLEMCFAPQRRALFRHRSFQKWSDHVVFCTFWLGHVLRATTACTFSTSQLPKVVRHWCVLYILTWTCASRHNGVHFFDIATSKSGPTLVCFVHFDLEMCFAPQRRALFRKSTSEPPKVVRTCSVLYIFTWKCASRHNDVHFFDIATSKSGPNMLCFVHFDFEMCFAPQRRALFRHRNFQKWSDIGVFCAFWLGHVLRATTACTFSTSQLPKVVRHWCVLYILTWKCASRHNGVHFFDIATSKSGPDLVCFVHFDLEMCFAPQRRALFRHRNFQKWSDILTWKCASRHNGVHFFDIATYKSGPDLVCFVHFHLEMCFAPQRRALSHLPSGQLPPHPPL